MKKIELVDAPAYYALIGPWLKAEDESEPDPHKVKFGDEPDEEWEFERPALRTGDYGAHFTYRRVNGKGRRIVDVNYRGSKKGFKNVVFTTS